MAINVQEAIKDVEKLLREFAALLQQTLKDIASYDKSMRSMLEAMTARATVIDETQRTLDTELNNFERSLSTPVQNELGEFLPTTARLPEEAPPTPPKILGL